MYILLHHGSEYADSETFQFFQNSVIFICIWSKWEQNQNKSIFWVCSNLFSSYHQTSINLISGKKHWQNLFHVLKPVEVLSCKWVRQNHICIRTIIIITIIITYLIFPSSSEISSPSESRSLLSASRLLNLEGFKMIVSFSFNPGGRTDLSPPFLASFKSRSPSSCLNSRGSAFWNLSSISTASKTYSELRKKTILMTAKGKGQTISQPWLFLQAS